MHGSLGPASTVSPSSRKDFNRMSRVLVRDGKVTDIQIQLARDICRKSIHLTSSPSLLQLFSGPFLHSWV